MKKRDLIIVIIGIILVAVLMANKVFQNDTFYTIKVGESIVKYGVDMVDHFSIHTLAYSYPHWLYDVFIYYIYSWFSYYGLYIFNIVTFVVIGLLFFFVNLRINKRFSVVSVMSLLATIMISAYVVVRAQSISYMMFLLEIYFLRRLLDKGKKRYIVYLFLISLVICNIHIAVWPLYFVLYLPYIVEFVISKFKGLKIVKLISKKIEIKREVNIKLLILTMFISLFTGVFTPLKGETYTYFIKTSLGNSQSYILEHGLGFGSLTIMVTLIVVFVLMVFLIVKSKKKIRIVDVFMVMGLGFMAILSQRHFALFIILGMINVSGMIVSYLENNSLLINMLFDSRLFRYIVIVEVVMVAGIRFMVMKDLDYIDCKLYPKDAVVYLESNYDVDKIRIFNEYDFGSYLILNDIPVFIDSRADLYTREFSSLSYDIFDDYMDISNGDIDKLESYDIDVVLLYKGRVLDSSLGNDFDYVEVYHDDYFVIYERRNITN